jgi:hypothetical protein
MYRVAVFLLTLSIAAFARVACAEEAEGTLVVQKLCPGTYKWVSIQDETEAATVAGCTISIYIRGPIDEGLPDVFRDAVEALKARNEISSLILDSPGGFVTSAMEIGRLVRSTQMRVVLDPGTECLSACVLILAAGVERFFPPNSRVGIHRLYFPPEEFAQLDFANAEEAYRQMSTRVKDYLREMRISETLFERMQAVNIDDVQFIEQDDAERLGLYGRDPIYQDLMRARLVSALGEPTFKSLDALDNELDGIMEQCGQLTGCALRDEFSALSDKWFDLFATLPSDDLKELAKHYWHEEIQ